MSFLFTCRSSKSITMFVLSVDQMTLKEELKSSTVGPGELSVILGGI